MQDIIAELETIKEKGAFFSKRLASLENFHLEVKGLGALKFPLKSTQIKSLLKIAHPAKFGWRSQTVLNKEVRNVLEIQGSAVKVDMRAWAKDFKDILEGVKKDLGLGENTAIKASLHNLLIYEPGSFFSAHQDSEKLNQMVATLVLILPSKHEGGTLVIDHKGIKKQIQTSRFPMDQLGLVSFYADCHHEVKKLSSGYRVALTYNLVLEHSKTPSLSLKQHSLKKLQQGLERYFSEEATSKKPLRRAYESKEPTKLVYLLDHQYTPKGLSWQNLKGIDRLRVEALKQLAEKLHLEAHLVLAEIQETWDCEVEDYDYSYYRRHNGSNSETDKNNLSVGDLMNTEVILKYWVTPEGKTLDLKASDTSYSELCWTQNNESFKPFNSEYEGFMGNYGNTLERWYHRAAIVLWRAQDHYASFFKIDPQYVVNELEGLRKQGSSELFSKVIQDLLPYWSEYLRVSENSIISVLLKWALFVEDAVLAKKLIKDLGLRTLSPERIKAFLLFSKAYGSSWCIGVFEEWSKGQLYDWDEDDESNHRLKRFVSLVEKMAENRDQLSTLIDWVLRYQFRCIQAFDDATHTRVRIVKEETNRIKVILETLKACVIAESAEQFLELIQYICAHDVLYSVLGMSAVLLQIKDDLGARDLKKWGYKKLLNHVLEGLKQEEGRGSRKTNDWSIQEQWSCKCEKCKILKDFLRDPVLKEKMWPLAKESRAHIHGIIDDLMISVTHETERKGSPHKLILEKTMRLHDEAKNRFLKLQKALKSVEKIASVYSKRSVKKQTE